MKITKKQLRRIIKEERAKLMAENPDIPDVMGAMGGGKFQPRKEKGHPRAAADISMLICSRLLKNFLACAVVQPLVKDLKKMRSIS